MTVGSRWDDMHRRGRAVPRGWVCPVSGSLEPFPDAEEGLTPALWRMGPPWRSVGQCEEAMGSAAARGLLQGSCFPRPLHEEERPPVASRT